MTRTTHEYMYIPYDAIKHPQINPKKIHLLQKYVFYF